MIRIISTFPKDPSIDAKGQGLVADAKEFLKVKSIEEIRCVKRFYLEGVNEEELNQLKDKLLVEEVWQDYTIDQVFYPEHQNRIEVAYKAGMMNPEVNSILETAHALGINSLIAADTSYAYYFYGEQLEQKEIDDVINKLVMNATIENIRTQTPDTLVLAGKPGKIQIVAIREMSDDELMDLSKHTLFLTLEEMHTIQDYYKKIGRDPYDGELEVLAQTWSEHCCHKTFNAKLIIDGIEVEPLYKRLKKATQAINHPHVISAFADNSGVWKLDDKWGFCGKVETHNSPSALDPFGGAATGSGGVFRDIVGTGQGAKCIASTDMFCVGTPDIDESIIPEGCKHPRFILKGIVRGVSAYGNPMGIPTTNGSVHFHDDFRCKPTVIVGAYGIIPLDKAQKGSPRAGDLVMSIGGRTGRDGIHGATFSSAEMTAETVTVNSTAVQIGNPIEEKRTFDAILELTAHNLIHAITDCGAGGFSSAMGEMGEEVGVHVELEKAPLKYTGLAPWEIFISESQERMVIAIAKEDLAKAQEILKKYNVEGIVMGRFTGDKQLKVTYNNETLCDLPMKFVHGGLSQLTLEGITQMEEFENPSEKELAKDNYTQSLHLALAHLNVCSKAPIVIRYDHNVQGTEVHMPIGGKTDIGPNNASVLEPIPGLGKGVVISHGLNPILNRIDPYKGTKWAIMEAIANAVAQGGNPENMAACDNFIWPKPDSKFIADLSKSIDACCYLSQEFRIPFISGKDSLSSTFTKPDGSKIHIPPVLCCSIFGVIDDIKQTISSPFKQVGNKIIVIGETKSEMGGSVYYDNHNYLGSEVPDNDAKTVMATFKAIHQGIKQGLIKSCQDVSEGGMITQVSEMCFGNLVGVDLELKTNNSELKTYELLFSESPGRFVCEVQPQDIEKLKDLLGEIEIEVIGEITEEQTIKVTENNAKVIIEDSLENLMHSWTEPMRKVFG